MKKPILFIHSTNISGPPKPFLPTAMMASGTDTAMVASTQNLEVKFWGQIFPLSGYDSGDGSIKLHIQDGVAPYSCQVKVNGAIFRNLINIPAPQFNYATFDEIGNYADINCQFNDLPAGEYSVIIFDAEGGEVRGFAGWNAVAPPYAELPGLIIAFGIPTNVFVQYGETQEYGYLVSVGVCDAREPQEFVLQLSSGEYNEKTGLAPGKLYHYRYYADNNQGPIQYGEDLTFETPEILPVVTTLPARNISM